jgi:hypothetical protein
MELPNKREMIQAVIDKEPEPWIIMKTVLPRSLWIRNRSVSSKILPKIHRLEPRSLPNGFKTAS